MQAFKQRWVSGRSPHGERGLKLLATAGELDVAVSLSSWRAWIEITRQPDNRHS